MASDANTNNKNDLPSTISVKLDKDNFPLWQSLVLPIIRSCILEGCILGRKESHEQYITNSYSSKKMNPSFEDWQAYDQQLLGWLKNSMTAYIVTHFLHCENLKKLWGEAQSLAGGHTRSRITYLKLEFHSTRKGEMKMHDCLSKMKILLVNSSWQEIQFSTQI